MVEERRELSLDLMGEGVKGVRIRIPQPDEHLFIITKDDPWYRDILTYFNTPKLSYRLSQDDQRCICQQASRYPLIGDVLYQRGVDTILCRCFTHEEAEHILYDCHAIFISLVSKEWAIYKLHYLILSHYLFHSWIESN